MSEEDVRVGLRDAVADEPPMDFDPDSLVAKARHQATRRRSLMAAGAATVAVVVAAVAIPVMLGRGSTQVGQQPTVTSTPSEWSQSAAQPVEYSAENLRYRSEQMASHLSQAVPAALPEASDITIGEFGGEASGEFYDGQSAVNAAISFSVGGARYSLVVTVWVPGATNELLDTICADNGTDCKQLGKEDGGPLVATTENLSDQGIISTVYHFRQNTSVVQIAAYNYDMTGTPMYMPTIPVTLQQLTTLAIDQELGL
jgi:hypothetical protein